MGATYFQYPFRGGVYAIDVDESALRKGRTVKLPDGTFVKVLVQKKGYLPKIEETTHENNVLIAEVVIPAEDSFERKFNGDWEPLIKLINAAAAVNTLFSVLLTQEEYLRLKNGGLAKMEKKFSERAFSLLQLCSDYAGEGQASLELYRTGQCPC